MELQLWAYTGTVLGQHRLLLVADRTVGGAKERFTTCHGTPSGKNGIPASTPASPRGSRSLVPGLGSSP